MEYPIEVLLADLERCKVELSFNKNITKWKQRLSELEAAIAKLKVDNDYITKLENACCDCADFDELGTHSKGCFLNRIRS